MPYPPYMGVPPDTRRKLDILSAEQGHRCCYCGRRFVEHLSRRDWRQRIGFRDPRPSIEHLQRIKDGGPRIYENEVAACRGCNVARGKRSPEEFYAIAKDGADAVAALCAKDPSIVQRQVARRYGVFLRVGEVVAMTPQRRAYFEMMYPGVKIE